MWYRELKLQLVTKLEHSQQLETYSVALKWHICCPMRHFNHVAPAVHQQHQYFLSSHFLIAVFIFFQHFFHDNVGRLPFIIVRTLSNGTIIKFYKYVYKYNRVWVKSGYVGIVIQLAVQAISLG